MFIVTGYQTIIMHTIVIPEHFTGKKNDLSFEKTCENTEQATFIFLRGCERLLQPGKWHLWAGSATACFELTDKKGQILDRPLQAGDYIRIDITGPGPGQGEGYDWVMIEIVDDQRYLPGHVTLLGIKMSVCANPMEEAPTDAAHFFKPPASSSLVITREDQVVCSYYHGRNETINNHTESVADNIRNTAVGAGAFSGLSEIQWNALLKGLLQNDL